MKYEGLYRYTAIGRPLDPEKPYERAVLLLLFAAFIAGALFEWAGPWSALRGAAVFALAVYGSWAFARELLPDDRVAPFVSMALGLLAAIAFHAPGLLVLFAAIGLVRVVTRSAGLGARVSDSIIVTCLVIWAVYACHTPWFGAVAAVAFLLDGVLKHPCKKQWLFAVICFGSMVVYIVDYDVVWWPVFVPDSLLEWLAVLPSTLLVLQLAALKKVHARGDKNQELLETERVKAGMAVGVLAALQGLESMPQVILLVASIGGLCIGMTFRRAFTSSSKRISTG